MDFKGIKHPALAPQPQLSWFHQGPTSSWPGFKPAGRVPLLLPMESNSYWRPFCLNSPGFIGFDCPWTFPRNNLIITWPGFQLHTNHLPLAPLSYLFMVSSCPGIIWYEFTGALSIPRCVPRWQENVGKGRSSWLQADPLNKPKCCCRRKCYLGSQTAGVFLVIHPWCPTRPLPHQEVQSNCSSQSKSRSPGDRNKKAVRRGVG